jgi:hypothetical protein
MNRRPRWNDEELARLRELREKLSVSECAKILGRSYTAVVCKSRGLGIRDKPHWTPEEEHRLMLLWGERSVENIAKKLGRSQWAVLFHARKLGLEIGCPQGYEYLAAAARRVGFGSDQLYDIIVATGYIASVRTSFTVRRGRNYCRRVIETDAADAAVLKWLATEPLKPAARRRGVCYLRLKRLVEAEIGPRPFGGKKHWRVPTELIDRVLARGAA